MTLHRMTSILPADLPTPTLTPAGLGDGAAAGEAIAHAVPEVSLHDSLRELDSEIYRDMRWCPNCAGEKVFVEVYEFESGRVGVCLGCGEERVVRFTRMVA